MDSINHCKLSNVKKNRKIEKYSQPFAGIKIRGSNIEGTPRTLRGRFRPSNMLTGKPFTIFGLTQIEYK